MRLRRLNACLMAVLAAIGLSACTTAASEPYSDTDYFFNTIIKLTIYEQERFTKSSKDIISDAFEQCRYYESLLSRTVEGSDIWNINHAEGEPVEVSAETIEIIETALSYYELSQGMFDITIGAVSELWSFDASEPALPDSAALDAALLTVGPENIIIDGQTISLANPSTKLDLGGIAKGFIADKLADFLQAEGVTAAIINLGGNVLTVGGRSGNETWSIGIQKPFENTTALAATVTVGEMSVVSSGIYERCFTLDGTLYHHMLDPHTGYPIENDLLSVSIITPVSVNADALSTTVFALGIEDGLALIESLPNTECVIIDKDGEFYVSSGMGSVIPYIINES